jgi:hypothetical protein
MRRSAETVDEPEMAVPLKTVCFIIMKAREFDAKSAVTEPDPGSNPSDDKASAVLEDHADDPVQEELTSLISALSEEEQIDLVALMWLGRDDYKASEWESVQQEAARARTRNTAGYLLGNPLLADNLADGLSTLGLSCEEFEVEHPPAAG